MLTPSKTIETRRFEKRETSGTWGRLEKGNHLRRDVTSKSNL